MTSPEDSATRSAWIGYLPMLTPLAFLVLRHIYPWGVGWGAFVSPPGVATLLPGGILLPSDIVMAGLSFDLTIILLFFRGVQFVSRGTAIACAFMAALWRPTCMLISLRLAVHWADDLATWGLLFWAMVFASVALTFSLPSYLVRS